MACAAVFALVPSAAAATFTVQPSDDVAQLVAAAPAGSTFVFNPGESGELSLEAKDGDVFLGSDGAILNGGRIVRDFVQDGRGFAATVSDLPRSTAGTVRRAFECSAGPIARKDSTTNCRKD